MWRTSTSFLNLVWATSGSSPRLGAAPCAARPLQDKRLLSAATPPGSEEVFLTIDTCAGTSFAPKGFDRRAIKGEAVLQTML